MLNHDLARIPWTNYQGRITNLTEENSCSKNGPYFCRTNFRLQQGNFGQNCDEVNLFCDE